jgi:hypothetical protein
MGGAAIMGTAKPKRDLLIKWGKIVFRAINV